MKVPLRYLRGLIDALIMAGFLLENKVVFEWGKGVEMYARKSFTKPISSTNFCEVFTH